MNAAKPVLTNEQSDITLQIQNKGDHLAIVHTEKILRRTLAQYATRYGYHYA